MRKFFVAFFQKGFVACLFCILCIAALAADEKTPSLDFTVQVKDVKAQLYHITFSCRGIERDSILFKMPAWTPGYYQLMNYADNVGNFTVLDSAGKKLNWNHGAANSWLVYSNKTTALTISYDIKATRPFVAANYLDKERGYISSAGVFIYPEGFLQSPVTVTIKPYSGWNKVATGLEPVKGKPYTFRASDYDVLFDSPVLMGQLEELPVFMVKDKPHYFIAYKAGSFNREIFINDLKKIVTAASDIIGDIPYAHYSFLAIGPGGGGIEHLNSASISFNGRGLDTREGRIRTYNFLAHEYFHHYNVKRIRPIELGPFDYDNGSKTKMLWLSEGVTVYYEYLIMKRAGLTSEEEFLKTFQMEIKDYEDKPGRYFQTPAEASYDTWSDGPFGRTGDEINKTISPYDKGPALGILLDFKIRHETKNKKSLDDLMRLLYSRYYKEKERGFTEEEFREEAENMAGCSLSDFFDYIYTLKPVDYPAYFSYAGLAIDTAAHPLPGAWLGISVKDSHDSLVVSGIEWLSPAWQADVHTKYQIVSVNGKKMTAAAFNKLLSVAKPGDRIVMELLPPAGARQKKEIILGQKREKRYTITRIKNPDSLQEAIFNSWSGN